MSLPERRIGVQRVVSSKSDMTAEIVLDALKGVIDPDLRRDIVSLGFVKNLAIDGGTVSFDIELTTPACPVKDKMQAQAEALVRALPGVSDVRITMTAQVRSVSAPEKGSMPVPGVKNVIAVGAGKGGVGKTTVAVNLALALSKAGSRVGILDGDIYGPNVPIMLGLQAQLESDGQKIRPAERYGLQVVSIGFMTKDEAPVIWRGPMLHSAIKQFFHDVAWRDLDYLIIDMPPGTGDVALSLAQTVPVAGSIVVTTPQQVSLADSRRAIRMYEKLNIPALGVVENMSYFECPSCHHEAEHLRPRRRRDDGRADGRAVPRPAADLRADSRRQRRRHSAGDRRARLGRRRRPSPRSRRRPPRRCRSRAIRAEDGAQGEDSAGAGPLVQSSKLLHRAHRQRAEHRPGHEQQRRVLPAPRPPPPAAAHRSSPSSAGSRARSGR